MSLGEEDDVTFMPKFSHLLFQEVHPCIRPTSLSVQPQPILLCSQSSWDPILKLPPLPPLHWLCGQDGVIL